MKKFWMSVSALLMLSLGFMFTACSSGDDDDSGTSSSTVTSILAVFSSSAKTSYTAGDTFDSTGIKVYAYYDGATTGTASEPGSAAADVTSSAKFYANGGTELVSGTTAMTTTMTSVSAVYSGKTAADTLTITVAAAADDDDSDWTLSEDGDTLTYTGSSTANLTVEAFDVSESDIFTVSFDATYATDQGDWAAAIIKTADNYIVTAPNLDPYNNTATDSSIHEKNAYPTASGAYLCNSLAYNSAFTGEKVAVTVSFNKTDKSIVYTLDDKAWVIYTSAIWDGGIEEFISAFASALTAGTAVFNSASLDYENLVITKDRASTVTATEIMVASSSVTADSTSWSDTLDAVGAYIFYSDGSADETTLADTSITRTYADSTGAAVESSAITEGTYTVTLTYGSATATLTLVVGSANTVSGSGTVADPYILASALATTIQSKEDAIDAYTYQSSTTWDSSATVCWSNPLYGQDISEATISFLVNNATGSHYDSILTFFPAGGTGWGGVAFTEDGTGHAQGHGYWDIWLTSDGTGDGTSSVSASTWTRITYVISGGSVTAYIDGTEAGTATCSDSGDTVAYLTGTCDKVAVGVGFNDQLWLAGYVDANTYLAGIKVYSTALTAAQVAAIE